MFGGLGMGEMILIFLVVLLLFGAKRLPEIGSSLGQGIREFKSSIREIEAEVKEAERSRYTRPSAPAIESPRAQMPAGPTPSQAPPEERSAAGSQA